MTSYTKILQGEAPCISLDPRNAFSKIDPNIYGGFTEYILLYGSPSTIELPPNIKIGIWEDVYMEVYMILRVLYRTRMDFGRMSLKS